MRHRVKKTGPVGFMNVKKQRKIPHNQPLPINPRVPLTDTSRSSTCATQPLPSETPLSRHLSDLKRLILQTEHPASTPVQHPQAEFKYQFSSTSQHLRQTFSKKLPDLHDIP